MIDVDDDDALNADDVADMEDQLTEQVTRNWGDIGGIRGYIFFLPSSSESLVPTNLVDSECIVRCEEP